MKQQNKEELVRAKTKELLELLGDENHLMYIVKDILMVGRCEKCWQIQEGNTCWNCYDSPGYNYEE